MAAGDISDILAARVRTGIDESTAAFWTDAEVFSALTAAQQEIVGSLLLEFKRRQDSELPFALRPLVNATSPATGTQNLPSGFLYAVEIYVNGTYLPINKRSDSYRYVEKNNTFLASSASQPYCSFNSTQIVLETSVEWVMNYIKSPADMTTSVDPTLPDITYTAMVEYAIAYLLLKDEKIQESLAHYEKYINLKNNLYV